MEARLLDYDKFIKINGIEEVSNPIMFDKGNIPTQDGLFSTEIFGVSTKERKNTFAYIDLKKKFLNPKTYITLKRLNRNFESLIYGTKRFNIVDGLLVEDENGGTGIDFLYKNWDKIKFAKNDSKSRNERVDVLTLNDKDIIFTSKFLIIPAFYRDINLQNISGGVNVNEINDLYARILRNVKMMQSANNFDFMLYTLDGKIQDTMLEVYNLLKDKNDGKEGYLRKFLMGKSVDYSSRVVITGVVYDQPNPNDVLVDFFHTGIPLSHICSLFTPFMIWWVKRYMKTRFENNKNNFPVLDSKGNKTYVKLNDPEVYYNEEYIKKRLDKFIKTPSTRFDPIEIPIKEDELKRIGKTKVYAMLRGFRQNLTTMDVVDDSGNYKVTRPLTWTDIFYMAGVDVTEDKHVMITRYPLLDYMGTYPTKISILSTQATQPMVINDRQYRHYPVIPQDLEKIDIEALFKDTINLHSLFLPAIGGDHDGDQVTCKGIFTQEANENADKIMRSKAYILNIYGQTVRNLGNEGIQTLYTLTRFKS